MNDDNKLSQVPAYSNPYERPTGAFFESTERIIESRKSYTCNYCHKTLSKLEDKWYCNNCNIQFDEEELPSEIYSERHEVDSPTPIPGFGVNDKWFRVLGGKRND